MATVINVRIALECDAIRCEPGSHPHFGMAMEGSQVSGSKRDRRRSEPQSQLPVEHKPGTLAFKTDRVSVVADRLSVANMICAAGDPVLSRRYQNAIGASAAMLMQVACRP